MWQYSQVLLLLTNLFRTTIHVPTHLFFYTVRRKLNKAKSCRVMTKGRQEQKPPYIQYFITTNTCWTPHPPALDAPYPSWLQLVVWVVCTILSTMHTTKLVYYVFHPHTAFEVLSCWTFDMGLIHILYRCFNYLCIYIYTAKKVVLTTECMDTLVAKIMVVLTTNTWLPWLQTCWEGQWFVLIPGANCMWLKQPVVVFAVIHLWSAYESPLKSLVIQCLKHDDETDICDGEEHLISIQTTTNWFHYESKHMRSHDTTSSLLQQMCKGAHVAPCLSSMQAFSYSYTHSSCGTPNCFVASALAVSSCWEVLVCCTWNTDFDSGLVTTRTAVLSPGSYLHEITTTTNTECVKILS